MADDEPEDIVSDVKKPRRPRKAAAPSPALASETAAPEPPEARPASDDEDVAELERMEISEARQRRAKLAQLPPARWSEAQSDQPFADEPPSDPRFEATQETRTAASTGARLPLTVALLAALVIHAVPLLATLAEKAHLGGTIYAALPAQAANLWLRTGPTRIATGFEEMALGALVVGLLAYGLSQIGRRLRIAAQMFAGAVVVNAAQWMLFSAVPIIKNPVLTDHERMAALYLMLVEVALAALLWLRVAPPYRPPSSLNAPRAWDEV